jgi:hypothetical protein
MLARFVSSFRRIWNTSFPRWRPESTQGSGEGGVLSQGEKSALLETVFTGHHKMSERLSTELAAVKEAALKTMSGIDQIRAMLAATYAADDAGRRIAEAVCREIQANAQNCLRLSQLIKEEHS